MSLDRQFTEIADSSGISVARLKTVYFRGVEEYYRSPEITGTPTMWGLARVQRFINSCSTGQESTTDADLQCCETFEHADEGIEVSVDAMSIINDVLYSDGSRTSAMFSPGEVLSIQYEDDFIRIDGELDSRAWRYTLDTVSGEHYLQIGDMVST